MLPELAAPVVSLRAWRPWLLVRIVPILVLLLLARLGQFGIVVQPLALGLRLPLLHAEHSGAGGDRERVWAGRKV